MNRHAFEESLNYQLIQLMKEHRQRAEEALSELGLHVSQELFLFVLWREEGLAQSELAACLRVELPRWSCRRMAHLRRRRNQGAALPVAPRS